jgi:hypothetical protein
MEARIIKFNRHQLGLAVLAAVLSVAGTLATYLFFKYICEGIWWEMEHQSLGWKASLIGCGITGLVWFEGIRRARNGAGLYEFYESPTFMDLDWSNGGAMLVETSITQYTGVAYMLTQVFLCGPLQALKCLHLLKSRMEPTPALAARLEALLGEVQQRPKWHSISLYKTGLGELRHLISMELVEFSPRKALLQPVKQPYLHSSADADEL